MLPDSYGPEGRETQFPILKSPVVQANGRSAPELDDWEPEPG